MVESRFSEIEIKWSIDQLIASGLLVQEGEAIRLSGSGIEYCLGLERKLGVSTALLMTMFYRIINAVLDDEVS